MSDQKSVCIVDDDAGVRLSIAALLDSAGYSHLAFASIKEFQSNLDCIVCDCILLDVRLPDGDGIDMLETLRGLGLTVPVVIITGHGDVPMAVKAMRLGAADFIEKPYDPDTLLQTIDRSYEDFLRKKINQEENKKIADSFVKLTPRETEVMKLLVNGQANKTVAFNLGLSPRTVELHRARVMQKTGAKSLSHLVRMAIAANLVG